MTHQTHQTHQTPTRRLLATALVASALLTSLVTSLLVAPAQAAGLPSREQWLSDTGKAMYGSRIWLRERVARPVDPAAAKPRYAINLDIDNTSLQTHYAPGRAVPATLRLATYAHDKHVAVLFNTGRRHDRLTGIKRTLRAAGYVYAEVCGRRAGERLTASKQRCRQHFVDEGYTILQNVGNRSTDFTGSNYEKGYKLPDYGNLLS